MKKYNLYLIAAIVFVSAAIASCNKDKDDGDNGLSTSTVTTIDATVEGGDALNDLIDEVRLVGSFGERAVLATAKFSNGGFKIDLPKTLPSNVLESIEGRLQDGVNVSNKNVKWTRTDMRAYDKDDNLIGRLYYSKSDENTWVYVDFIYSDGDCNITGNVLDEKGIIPVTYSVSLKKGWNQMFNITNGLFNDEQEQISTTTIQSGLKWVFGL